MPGILVEDCCDVGYPPVPRNCSVVKLSRKIVVRNEASSMASSFSTLAGMRSDPGALLGSSLSRRFDLPSLLTLISEIA